MIFKPKLGVSLHTLSHDLTEELLRTVAGSRIATLEIATRILDTDANRSRIAPLKEMLARSGVRPMTIHAFFGKDYDCSVPDRSARGRALAAAHVSIDIALELGAPMIVVHASAEPIAPSERGARFEWAQAGLAEIGKRCQEKGLRVAVELLPRTCLGNTVDELLAILDPLDGDVVGVCLDTNHLMDRYEDLAHVVLRLGDRLFTLHLSDYDGVDEQHELPGKGVLDWGSFVRALQEIDYGGPFNYESKLDGETPTERIKTLEGNFDWLSSL